MSRHGNVRVHILRCSYDSTRTVPLEPWQLFWAKTDRDGTLRLGEDWTHPLWAHLFDVASAAEVLADRLPEAVKNRLAAHFGLTWSEVRPLLALIVGLHDAGKAIPPFQHQPSAPEPVRQRLSAAGLVPLPNDARRHHGHASIPILHDWLNVESAAESAQPILKVLAAFAGFHHGRIDPKAAWSSPDALGREAWREEQRQLVSAVAEAWMTAHGGWPDLNHAEAYDLWPYPSEALAFAGWTTLADWVGSMSVYMPKDAACYADDLAAYLPRSRATVEAALEAAHLHRGPALRASGTEADFKTRFPAVFSNGAVLTPHPLQGHAASVALPEARRPALVLIEAPTGEGKTEAAFYLAARLQARRFDGRGVYVALPSQATSNGLFPRFVSFLGEGGAHDSQAGSANVLLAHGASGLNLDLDTLLQPVDEDEAARSSAYAARWFLPTKRSLLAPYGVGTVDQALLGTVTSRHFFLRLYGLAGKAVVFDEVHAYDGYMTSLFARLLEWLRALGSDVVILTATLPKATRRAFLDAWGTPDVPDPDAYPVLTVAAAPEDGAERGRIVAFESGFATSQHAEAEVEFGDSDPAHVVACIAKAVKEGATVGVILNRVDRAQTVFELLQGERLDADLCLLHARFPFAERQRRERTVIERFGKEGRQKATRPAVLVATQVAEQSLDLDVDLMLSDLAPIDLLLQRAGRLHRHRLPRPAGYQSPRLVVLRPPLDTPNALPDVRTIGGQFQDDDSDAIYLNLPLFHTDLLLRARVADGRGWTLPEDYRPLIEAVYGEDAGAMPAGLCTADEARWRDAVKAKRKLEKQQARTADLAQVPEPEKLKSLLANQRAAQRTDYDEDDDAPARDLKPQTRLGGPSVQVVCLHRRDGRLYLDADVPLSAGPRLTPDEQRAVLERAVRLNRKGVVYALERGSVLTDAEAQQWARLAKESAALAFHHPIAFEDGRCTIGKTVVELHPDLGIRYNPDAA